MYYSLVYLPEDYLFTLALSLFLPEIYHLSLTNKQLKRLIIENDYFWQQKFVNDHPSHINHQEQNYQGSWKSLYQQFLNLWAFGNIIAYASNKRKMPNIVFNFKVKQVSVGYNHVVLLDFDNNCWIYGNNGFGQLGLGNNDNIIQPTMIPSFKALHVAAGNQYTIILDLDNNIWAFGRNDHGQLGLGDKENRNRPTKILNFKAKQVAAGGYHTLIIDDNDKLWTCGYNDYGQLGLSGVVDRCHPTLITLLSYKRVAAGFNHSVVMDINNNVWTFGYNVDGQLVLGSDLRAMIISVVVFQH